MSEPELDNYFKGHLHASNFIPHPQAPVHQTKIS